MGCPVRPGRQGPRIEVARILRDHVRGLSLSLDQARVVGSLVGCRTSSLGGRVYECDDCGQRLPIYNSCRNRHCPKCGVLEQELWADAQGAKLLPVPYFHLVFTIPSQLHPFFLRCPRECLSLLFAAVSATVLEVAQRRLGVKVGLTAVLHTWTQKLLFHPHIHCVVAAGGLSPDRSRWISSGERFFLPVRILRTVFRGKLLSGMEAALDERKISLVQGSGKELLRRAARVSWRVYAKRPLGGPEQVVRYVSRYTQRIAISNSRLLDYDGEEVTFSWRDRADGNRKKKLSLPGAAFLSRFLRHVLPSGFVRIRHYGLFASRIRNKVLALANDLWGREPVAEPEPQSGQEAWVVSYERVFASDPLLCPVCREGRLVLQATVRLFGNNRSASSAARAPP